MVAKPDAPAYRSVGPWAGGLRLSAAGATALEQALSAAAENGSFVRLEVPAGDTWELSLTLTLPAAAGPGDEMVSLLGSSVLVDEGLVTSVGGSLLDVRATAFGVEIFLRRPLEWRFAADECRPDVAHSNGGGRKGVMARHDHGVHRSQVEVRFFAGNGRHRGT